MLPATDTGPGEQGRDGGTETDPEPAPGPGPSNPYNWAGHDTRSESRAGGRRRQPESTAASPAAAASTPTSAPASRAEPPPPPPDDPGPPPPPHPARPILVDSDRGQALFTFPQLGAGRSVTRCITVTYRGPAPSPVRLFAPRVEGELAHFLKVEVARGTARSTERGRCLGFKRDARLFQGRLDDFPTTYEEATARRRLPAWRSNESHTYRFRVRLASSNAAQGLSAGFDFAWEART